MSQPSKLSAILHERCPRCRQGKVFEYPISRYDKFTRMHERCPHCGLRFEREPGEFYGAMYVSYAFSVALFVAVFVVLYVVFNDPAIWIYIVTVVGLNLALIPVFFRYSRMLYLHLFSGIRYRPEARA
ncbi:MAG: DUF983 domain-containing protein [Catalinimonas sp.]